MIEKGLDTAVADRIVEEHLKLGPVMDRVEESQEQGEEVVVTRAEASKAEIVKGFLHLIRVHREMLHNHTLFR